MTWWHLVFHLHAPPKLHKVGVFISALCLGIWPWDERKPTLCKARGLCLAASMEVALEVALRGGGRGQI